MSMTLCHWQYISPWLTTWHSKRIVGWLHRMMNYPVLWRDASRCLSFGDKSSNCWSSLMRTHLCFRMLFGDVTTFKRCSKTWSKMWSKRLSSLASVVRFVSLPIRSGRKKNLACSGSQNYWNMNLKSVNNQWDNGEIQERREREKRPEEECESVSRRKIKM